MNKSVHNNSISTSGNDHIYFILILNEYASTFYVLDIYYAILCIFINVFEKCLKPAHDTAVSKLCDDIFQETSGM